MGVISMSMDMSILWCLGEGQRTGVGSLSPVVLGVELRRSILIALLVLLLVELVVGTSGD